MEFPPTTTIRGVIAALDSGSSIADVRSRLVKLANSVRRADLPAEAISGRQARGLSFYERLVEDILALVRAAGSRESLVRLAMDRLGTGGQEKAADGYLLLEGISSRGGDLQSVAVVEYVGFPSARVANFAALSEQRLAGSRMVKDLLINARPIDFLATEQTRGYIYAGEFDGLIDRKRGAWLAAVPLPALDDRHPNRALVGIFPVSGDRDQPLLPRGATQEWRCLEFLRIAYDLLNHQLASIAEQARAQRRDLLADLAPGIVNHEINQQIRILADSTDLMNLAVRRLPQTLHQAPPLLTIIDALARQYHVLDRLTRISGAFNNLDKRTPGAEVALRDVLADVTALLHYRLANAGIALDISSYDETLTLRTDATLLEHIMLNVLMNAADAFSEQAPSAMATGDADGARRVIITISRQENDMLALAIGNNGPPIPEALRPRIFDRGVSSKPAGIGHGLGLYICRLAARFLGGTIDLVDPPGMLPGQTVAFRIELPRNLPERGVLADEGAAETSLPRRGGAGSRS